LKKAKTTFVPKNFAAKKKAEKENIPADENKENKIINEKIKDKKDLKDDKKIKRESLTKNLPRKMNEKKKESKSSGEDDLIHIETELDRDRIIPNRKISESEYILSHH